MSEIWLVIIPTLAGFITAVFAVYKWAKERQKDRSKEESKFGALYLNPFISACEDLQSRLYNILELGGLSSLQGRSDKYPIETLYLFVRFFAWTSVIFRYSHYTRDRIVIGLLETIKDIFSTDKLGEGAFCFSRLEQDTLAKLVLEKNDGQYGVEFDIKELSGFYKEMWEEELGERESIKRTLIALEKENISRGLDGHAKDRLALVQNYLVDLLSYLEEKERISMFLPGGKRKKANIGNLGQAVQVKRYAAWMKESWKGRFDVWWLKSGRYKWSKIRRKLFERSYRNNPLPEVQASNEKPACIRGIVTYLDQITWEGYGSRLYGVNYPQTVWTKQKGDSVGISTLAATLLQQWDKDSEPKLISVITRPTGESHTVCAFKSPKGWSPNTKSWQFLDKSSKSSLSSLRYRRYLEYSDIVADMFEEKRAIKCWFVMDPFTFKMLEFHSSILQYTPTKPSRKRP